MAHLLSRLGLASARHRWAVVSGWAAALVVLAVVALTGMRFSDGGFDVPGTPSSEAMGVLEQELGGTGTASRSLQLVVAAPAGQQVSDATTAAEVAAARADLAAVPGVTGASDPFDPARPTTSPDGSTAVVTVDVAASADAEAVTRWVGAVAEQLRTDGLTAEVGGTLQAGAPEILGPTEVVGAALAFLVLLLTFGSLAAAGANMLGALVGVGVGVLGVLASSVLHPIGSTTPVLAVMLGLAVGIDYCLFVLARFRSELREGVAVEAAIGRATGTAGSSVVFAGATVVIALVGLTVVGIPFLGEMGLAAAVAVVVAVLMALTLLPALLRMMGRRALPRRERDSTTAPVAAGPAAPRGGLLHRWVGVVTRHRVASLLGGALLLGAVALPVTSMQTTLAVPGGEDPHSSQRAAYDLVAEAFGAGAQDPLVVLVRHDDVERVLPAVQSDLAGLPGVASVVPAATSADGGTAMLTVTSAHGPLDERTEELVRDLRQRSGAVDGAQVLVTGSTAIGLDSDEQLSSALVTYLAIIVGLSLVLLVVLFRSVLVPVIATAGFLLSLGAGLGATVAVFQWGWLGPLVAAPQGNPLLSLLPVVVTGILFGLAMDYQVFLVSRMHEAHARGASAVDAVRAGFRRSAPVVVAAAAIMAAVFGGFALSPSSLVGSIALALAVGVVADAFVVRMVLVPAALALLGEAAWWTPRWLDRLLPRIDVEGSALEARAARGEEGGDAACETDTEPEPAGAR